MADRRGTSTCCRKYSRNTPNRAMAAIATARTSGYTTSVRHDDSDCRVIDAPVADIQLVDRVLTKRALRIRPLAPLKDLIRFHIHRPERIHLGSRLVSDRQVLRAEDLQVANLVPAKHHRHFVRDRHDHVIRARGGGVPGMVAENSRVPTCVRRGSEARISIDSPTGRSDERPQHANPAKHQGRHQDVKQHALPDHRPELLRRPLQERQTRDTGQHAATVPRRARSRRRPPSVPTPTSHSGVRVLIVLTLRKPKTID